MKKYGLAYHTARRFASMALWTVAFVLVLTAIPHVLQFSDDYLGSSWYALIVMLLSFMLYISYKIAKLDVSMEERRSERVFDELSKD